jgi:uncharacterized protein (DUF952 family)
MDTIEIYHICAEAAWKATVAAGRYEGSSLDRADGFIHCSSADTVQETANRFFAGRQDLVLLVIDPAKVDGDLKWEPAPDRDDVLFPHLYGTVPLGAIKGAVPIAPDREGHFRLPEPRGGLLPL